MNRRGALTRRLADGGPATSRRPGRRAPDVVLRDDWAGIMTAVGLFESRGDIGTLVHPAPDDIVFARYRERGVEQVGAGARITRTLAGPGDYADAVHSLIRRAIAEGVQPGRAMSAAQATAARNGDAGGSRYLADNDVRPRMMAAAWATEDAAAARLQALFPGRQVAAGPRVIRVWPQDALAFCGLPDLFLDDLIVDVKTCGTLHFHLDGDGLIPIGPTWIVNPASPADQVHRPDLYLVGDRNLQTIGAVAWSTVVRGGQVRDRDPDHDRLRAEGQARRGTPWFWVRKSDIAWTRREVVTLVDSLDRAAWS